MEYEVIGLTKVDKEWLDKRPNLKVIGCNCTGIDHIDLEECKKRDIKVISLQGHTKFLKDITSTAEHTIGLILAVMRNYKKAFNSKERVIGHILLGKTLTIIGLGRIGRQVKKIAQAFGIRVLSFEKGETGLKDLLEESDIVSIHIPLENNIGYFTKEMFTFMKSTAILINTSRDRVIEKGALTYALENNIIAGAGIDFIDDLELLEYSKNHNNLVLTPHCGGATVEDMAITERFIKKLIANYIYDNTRT